MNDWMTTGAALMAGGCMGLTVWLLARPVVNLEAEDRRWRDPPPGPWQPFWPVARVFDGLIGPRLPARRAEAMKGRLQRAGLEFSVTPGQYVGVRIAHGLALAALALVIGLLLGLAADGWWLLIVGVSGLAGATLPEIQLRDRIEARRKELVRSLPFCLDLITLCVEAGQNLQGAIAQAVAKGPRGALREELQRSLRDVRAGRTRADALRGMAERCGEPSVSQFVQAVIQADAMGMNLGPVLRAPADQRRAERFLRAEKLAMQAPVKLLLPLIACIFPCTFAVLFFPIAMKFIQPGLL